MGYLNKQLEKVASVVEEGMEKKALSVRDLLRIGQSAAVRGPESVSNLAKRLIQRNKAIDTVMPSRLAELDAANRLKKLLHGLLGSKQGKTDSYYNILNKAFKAEQRIPGGKPIALYGTKNIENAFHAPVAGKFDIDDLAKMQYL